MSKCIILFAALILLTSVSCKEKSEVHDDHQHDAQAQDKTETPNEKLYNEVMQIHNEVMPKMDDIHRLKMSIRERIEKTPNLSKVERMKLDAMYAKLDSANEGMMDWMHEFRPLPDSVGEEKARQYLEAEMERMKKVKERMLNAIESAEALK